MNEKAKHVDNLEEVDDLKTALSNEEKMIFEMEKEVQELRLNANKNKDKTSFLSAKLKEEEMKGTEMLNKKKIVKEKADQLNNTMWNSNGIAKERELETSKLKIVQRSWKVTIRERTQS